MTWSTIFSDFKVIITFLPMALGACDAGQTASGNAVQNANQNMVRVQQKKADSVMEIKKSTVGKIADYSIGLRSIDNSVADVAVYNTKLPQVKRNDYVVGFSFRKGDAIPIGNNFYKVIDITADAIQIETEPVKNEKAVLQPKATAIPEKGILELNGFSVEVVSVNSSDDKTSASVEIYDNDVPKTNLDAGKITKATISSGDEINIGDKKYKVVAVSAKHENFPAVLEISNEPLN